ncbi:hypothetical protein G6F42_015760 [Rhizopus arrhizus]|nr:hypothetical protein G6F42_015760 [Rhizopus arrhizus]
MAVEHFNAQIKFYDRTSRLSCTFQQLQCPMELRVLSYHLKNNIETAKTNEYLSLVHFPCEFSKVENINGNLVAEIIKSHCAPSSGQLPSTATKRGRSARQFVASINGAFFVCEILEMLFVHDEPLVVVNLVLELRIDSLRRRLSLEYQIKHCCHT